MMNTVDINLLEEICKLLKPFKDVTTVMSTESSSSVSLIRPLLMQLKDHCKPTPELEDLPLIHEAKAAMFHDLETR